MTDLTPKKWRAVFLQRLIESPNIAAACRRARISRQAAYQERAADPEFAAAWEAARQMGLDALEDKAIGRAEKESDTLMIFLLKAHRPERYNMPQRHALGGDPGAPPIKGEIVNLDADAYNREFAALLGIGDGAGDGDADAEPQP